MTFAVGRISKCTLKLKLLVFLFCSPEVGLSYHVKCADRSAPSPNLRVSENRPIVIFETVQTLLNFRAPCAERQTANSVRITAMLLHQPCAMVPSDPFIPGTDELCSGRRPASRHMVRAINISERRLHHQQAMTQGFDRLAAQPRPAVAPAPRAQLYTVCPGKFLAAEAALGLQPAAPLPCRWDHSPVQVQEEREVITRPGSRAAATDTLRRAAPCAVASPGRFTSKTYALCSGRRLARLHVCCARLTAASTHAAL